MAAKARSTSKPSLCVIFGGASRATNGWVARSTVLWAAALLLIVLQSQVDAATLADFSLAALSLSVNRSSGIVEQITPHAAVRSSTRGAGRHIQGMIGGLGFAGQKVFRFRVPRGGPIDLVLTTCSEKTSFRTILLLFDSETNRAVCGDGCNLRRDPNGLRCHGQGAASELAGATVEYRAWGDSADRDYLAVVTGIDGGSDAVDEGDFELIVELRPGLPSDWARGLNAYVAKERVVGEQSGKRNAGARAWMYLLGDGIRATHPELGGRLIHGFDSVDVGGTTGDYGRLGSHLAAIAAGRIIGVAPGVNVVSVRVRDSKGRIHDWRKALRWVAKDAISRNRKPALALTTMQVDRRSLKAMRVLVDAGLSVVTPAGDSATRDCASRMAAGGLEVVTVGSADSYISTWSASSSIAPCADLYATGYGQLMDGGLPDWRKGAAQSLASAASVAGVVAHLLSLRPELTPADVKIALLDGSTHMRTDTTGPIEHNQVLVFRSPPPTGQPAVNRGAMQLLFVAHVLHARVCDEKTKAKLLQTIKEVIGDLDTRQVVVCRCEPSAIERAGAADSNGARRESNVDITGSEVVPALLILYRIVLSNVEGPALLQRLRDRISSDRIGQSVWAARDSTPSYDLKIIDGPWAYNSQGYIYPRARLAAPEPPTLTRTAIAVIIVSMVCIVFFITFVGVFVFFQIRSTYS